MNDKHVLEGDCDIQYGNPNLSLDGESFALAFPPRTTKPWLDAADGEMPVRMRADGRA